RTILAAFAHQDFPFEELLDTLARERSLKLGTLTPVMITLHNSTLWPRMHARQNLTFAEPDPNMLGGPLVAPNAFEISLMLRETSRGVTGSCVYKPQFFDAVTIERLLRELQEVLQMMVEQPDRPISEIQVSLNRRAPNPQPSPGF